MTLEQQIRERKEEEEKKVLSQEYPYYPPSTVTQDIQPKSNEDNRADFDMNK